jgi:hypothetical protein
MGRHIAVLGVLTVFAVLATSAGASRPAGPPPGTEPANPIPAGCDLAEIHPSSCLVYTVSCPRSSKLQFLCSSVRVAGPSASSVRVLALKLPRTYTALVLNCALSSTNEIGCRSVSRKLVSARGTRLVGVRLPQSFSTLHVLCGLSASKAFACRLGK